jgi:hypothetical protein
VLKSGEFEQGDYQFNKMKRHHHFCRECGIESYAECTGPDVADHVVVMDAGQVVEQGPAEDVLLRPKNPRTASFLSRLHSTIGERKGLQSS